MVAQVAQPFAGGGLVSERGESAGVGVEGVPFGRWRPEGGDAVLDVERAAVALPESESAPHIGGGGDLVLARQGGGPAHSLLNVQSPTTMRSPSVAMYATHPYLPTSRSSPERRYALIASSAQSKRERSCVSSSGSMRRVGRTQWP